MRCSGAAGRERAREEQQLAVARRVGPGVEVERGLGGAGVRVRGRIVGGERQEHGGMVGETATDTGQVVPNLDAGGAQVVRRSDPGPQEQVRGPDGPRGEHDLARVDGGAVDEPHADGAGAVEQDALDRAVAADGERPGILPAPGLPDGRRPSRPRAAVR